MAAMGSMPESKKGKRPARGYSWPPFELGNVASLKGGWRSPAKVEPLAAEFVAAAVEAVPSLGEPSFMPAVWAWARAEASVRLIFDYVNERGLFDDEGDPTVSLDWLLKF